MEPFKNLHKSLSDRLPELSLILIFLSISTALVSSGIKIKPSEIVEARDSEMITKEVEIYPNMPIYLNKTESPPLSANGVVVIEQESGKVLFEKNSKSRLLPASTVKIMTSVVAAESYPFSQGIVVPHMNVEGQKMHLVPGEEITIGNLIAGLLISSANDAAEVLAMIYPSGRDGFINAMNSKATELHLNDTRYATPSGLDGEGQYTSAYDLALLSRYAVNFPWFADTVDDRKRTVASINGKYVHKLETTNELLDSVEGVKGIKTGWTEMAHENLVTYYDKDGKSLIIVVLSSLDRFGETKTILDWVLNNYEWKNVK